MDRWRPGTLLAVVLLLTVSTRRGREQPEDGRALPGKDWPLVGGDWTSARYSTLDQINTTNVKTLGGCLEQADRRLDARDPCRQERRLDPAGRRVGPRP